MIDRAVNRDEAIQIAQQLRDELPHLALVEKVRLHNEGANPRGLVEWTSAVWQFFHVFAKTRKWNIFPPTKPKRGRGKGEYLVDFAVFDGKHGCRIACESDWGGKTDVAWAFDKLRGVKADLKVLLFEARHESEMPERFRNIFVEYLSAFHHHMPGREFYIFLQFEGQKAKLYLFEPKSNGPTPPDDLVFEEIA